MIQPHEVRYLADLIRRECKTEPTVDWEADRARWRVSVANERVAVSVEYKITSGRRWVWSGSTLMIDGAKAPIASDFWHFLRVWNNPEELANRVPVPPPFSTPIEPVPISSFDLDTIQGIKIATNRGLVVTAVGYVDDNFCAVDLKNARSTIRVHWPRHGEDKSPDASNVYLIFDGVDISDQVQGKFSKALAFAEKASHPGVADPSSVDGEVGSQRDRGVEVRSTHVIRN